MFSLTIVFGPRATTWTLMYKEKESAYAARHQVHQGAVVDDFGQTAYIVGDVHGIMLEDLSLSREVYIEKSLHEARIMADAQKRAQNERGKIVPMGGPAMITPGIR